jgi:hypothetical protein
MSSVRPWPDLPSDTHWTVEMFEEELEKTSDTPQELRARAAQLRAEAATSEFGRHAALAMADRYEAAAVARLTSA